MAIVLYIIGAAFAVYGVSIMLTWSGTWFFAIWYVLAAIAIGLGIAVQTGAWEHIPLLIRRIFGACAAACLVVLAITQVLVFGSFNATPDEEADYLIVLGAQVHPSGPSVVLQYRLDTAYDYLLEHPDTRCIVSGGQGSNEVAPEADIMAQYLIGRGIAEDRIIRETASTNTAENIAFSRQIIGDDDARIVIVSNNFHMYRALALAEKQGLAHASGLAAGSRAWYLPNNLLRESFGIVKDFAFGNI